MVGHKTRTRSGGSFEHVVVRADIPSITSYGPRHTAVSLAVSAGTNVKTVQRMLGHKSAAMTLDVYADLIDDDLEAVATTLGRARADVLALKTRSR